MFELPNDLLIDIFHKKAELEMAERSDLYITNHHNACYSCGNHTEGTKCRFNGVNYKFCSFCWGGPVVDDTEDFIDYVNAWQTGDILRMEKMYHQAVAPTVPEETWNGFWGMCLNEEERSRPVSWVKMTFDRWIDMAHKYDDIEPDSPLGNQYVIFFDDEESDADSGDY
jgi:hypothetical protein